MIEGVSGILAAHVRSERPTWIPSRRRLEWPSGVIAQAFSAEDPDSLRGPQFAAAWCDDLDPEHEPMNRNHLSKMPQVVVDAFEAEGWFWGGRFKQRQDPMHFQAAHE